MTNRANDGGTTGVPSTFSHIVLSGTSASTFGTGLLYNTYTPSGMEVGIVASAKPEPAPDPNAPTLASDVARRRAAATAGLNPKLYFKYIKSKLSASEIAELKRRTMRLRGFAQDAIAAGQSGLYERLLLQLAVLIREQEASVCGHGQWVTQEVIDKFKNKVQGRVVELCRLEEFPRAMPKDVQSILKAVKDRAVFDEFWVLHTNLTKERVKPAEQRIKEKDPILFGKFSYDPQRFFHVASWVDEFCDLTMDEFVKGVRKQEDDDNWQPQVIAAPSADEVKAILAEAKKRWHVEQNVNRMTFEEKARQASAIEHALAPAPTPEPAERVPEAAASFAAVTPETIEAASAKGRADRKATAQAWGVDVGLPPPSSDLVISDPVIVARDASGNEIVDDDSAERSNPWAGWRESDDTAGPSLRARLASFVRALLKLFTPTPKAAARGLLGKPQPDADAVTKAYVDAANAAEATDTEEKKS